MFAIDAGLAMAWCFEDEATKSTDAALDRLRDDQAAVPAVWPLEVANVFIPVAQRAVTPRDPAPGHGAPTPSRNGRRSLMRADPAKASGRGIHSPVWATSDCPARHPTVGRRTYSPLAAGAMIALALQVRLRTVRQVVAAVALLTAAIIMSAVPVCTSVVRSSVIAATSGSPACARSQHRLFGLGSQYYASLAKYEEGLGGQAFHAHNTFVQMVVMGGAVGLVLVGAIAAVSLGSAVRWAGRGINAPAVLLGTFFVSATLEWSFGFFDRDLLRAVTVLPMAIVPFAEHPRKDLPSAGSASRAVDQTQLRDGPSHGVT